MESELGFNPEKQAEPPRSPVMLYRNWLAQQGATANTIRAYYSRIKHFLIFLDYADLKKEQILKEPKLFAEAASLYRDFLKQSDAQAISVNAVVYALLNFARFLKLERPQIEKEKCRIKLPRTLSANEQDSFLKSVERQESVRDRALALVFLYTAIRIGDCALLNITDVSITNEIGGGKAQAQNHLCLASGNKVQLNRPLAFVLRQWLNERERVLADRQEPALWINNRGKRLSIAGMDFVIRRIGWQAHLVLSSEVLRQTCLANAARSSPKATQAAQFGGYINHAAVNRYSALSQSESSKLIDNLLNPY